MVDKRRPYLIVPKLILQPTWGGKYIAETKGLGGEEKIGQSYELFSGSKLLLAEENREKIVEVGWAEEPGVMKEAGGAIPIKEVLETDLLIKFTQAKGNSFQLHIKPGVDDPQWQPKPETWYFLGRGKTTIGIKEGIDLGEYRQVCREIDDEIRRLAQEIRCRQKTAEVVRDEVKRLIAQKNPWRFVQEKWVEPGEVIDMSRGGIHHSWEEDEKLPLGNILYEVQLDRMDPVSTIRAFDQGKIGDRGEVRRINIEDYFRLLDTSREANTTGFVAKTTGGNNVFTTDNYAMDVIMVDHKMTVEAKPDFDHWWVKSGRIKLETSGGGVTVEQGWSGISFTEGGEVTITPESEAVVLRTYVPQK